MSWAALFWILYGAGSTVFVIYLFKLGKNVASNRKELIEQEIQRIRSGKSDEADVSGPDITRGLTLNVAAENADGDHTQLLQVQRIFQPDSEHVAVEGVRDGARCLINLPVGKDAGFVRAGSEIFSATEKG